MTENHSFPDDLMCRECFYRPQCTQVSATLCAAGLLLPPVSEDECCGCRRKAEHMHQLYGMHFCQDCYDRLAKSLERRTYTCDRKRRWTDMRIDSQGRILIPREFRQRFEWADSFDITFSQDGGQLILTPQRGRECSCCLEFKRNLQQFGNIRLCPDCMDRIAQYVKDETL